MILREEAADVLTVYDERGGYGHPDHVQVHHVGMRAGEIAGVPRVHQATTNREEMRRLIVAAAESGLMGDGDGPSEADVAGMGTPEAQLTTRVDVTPWIAAKRDAMRAHSSQIARTRSSSHCPTRRSRWPSAPSGSCTSARDPGPPWETDLFGDQRAE